VKFLEVKATGFGAMRDRHISFAPGFTLVYGPNEAGKSTWHAALYAAFCGMRRGRTEVRADEDFIRQYRPWDFPNTWAVSTTVKLEDGRRVQLQQELVERIECRATDIDSGRDYTSDINNEGCPDGALWLGLDRRSFIATAYIRQSQLLEVLNNPDILQTHLQRAAATCAVNSNGAFALQLLESYRAERVGEDRPNSSKPLPAAIRRVETLKRALGISRTEHARYLELVAAETRGKLKVEKFRAAWNLSRAIIADKEASEWERRLQRLLQIIGKNPERPTGDIQELMELAHDVSAALRIWQERPAVPDLSGATVAEIQAEIELLPTYPTGELEPDPKVLKSEAELLASKYALTLHAQGEPAKPVMPDTKGVPAEQLRQLSSMLNEPEPEVDPRLEEVVGSSPVSERTLQKVRTAIDVWERRPTFTNNALVKMPEADDIQRQIDDLPVAAEGDLQPAREVLDAANKYSSSKEAIRQHGLNKPPDPEYPNVEATSAEMRTLAQRLREPVSTVLDSGIWRRSQLSKEVTELTKSRSQAVMVTAIVGVTGLGASVYFLLNMLPILGGIAAAVVGLVVAVHVLKTSPITAKQRELDNLPKEPDPATVAANAGPNRDLINRIERMKLPPNAEELEKLADLYDNAQVSEQMLNLWKETEKRIQAMSDKCASDLESALYGRVAGYVSNLEEAVIQYQEECAERARIASTADRREDLQRQLAMKIEADTSAAEIRKRQEEAATEMHSIAVLCEISAEGDEELALKLQEFLDEAERRRQMEKELAQHIFVRSAWKKRRAEATKQLQAVSLSADPAAIRALTEELDRAQLVKAAYDNWEQAYLKLRDDYDRRASHMSGLLQGKGMEVSEDVEQAVKQYREGCETRAMIAVKARHREQLERQLVTRKQIEETAAAIQLQRENAKQGLLAAAARCEIAGNEESPVSESLLEWLSSTSKTVRKQQEAYEEWRELDTLLEGRTLQEFKEKAQQHRENALIAGAAFSGDELHEAMLNLAKHEANLPELTTQLEIAGQELANLQGQIHNYETRPTSVSDAEEDLRAAEDELARIRQLSETLEATHAFLTQAKNRVFRDIAPFLADSVKKWLPAITMGRYVDARVDPNTLQVQVSDESGKWRQAALLSYGTAEQVYLLLRLAMTEYLTTPGEVCPLILDDITVQSDSRRKKRILDTLKIVSQTRQVIIFTQEDQVYDWACENLKEPEGWIVDLVPATVATVQANGNGRRVHKPVDAA